MGHLMGTFFMMLTWLKSEEHISASLHHINCSVKLTAESTVIFMFDGHRSHTRNSNATATGWEDHVTLYCLQLYSTHKT